AVCVEPPGVAVAVSGLRRSNDYTTCERASPQFDLLSFGESDGHTTRRCLLLPARRSHVLRATGQEAAELSGLHRADHAPPAARLVRAPPRDMVPLHAPGAEHPCPRLEDPSVVNRRSRSGGSDDGGAPPRS